jgi:hypothetical protein
MITLGATLQDVLKAIAADNSVLPDLRQLAAAVRPAAEIVWSTTEATPAVGSRAGLIGNRPVFKLRGWCRAGWRAQTRSLAGGVPDTLGEARPRAHPRLRGW